MLVAPAQDVKGTRFTQEFHSDSIQLQAFFLSLIWLVKILKQRAKDSKTSFYWPKPTMEDKNPSNSCGKSSVHIDPLIFKYSDVAQYALL